MNLKYILQLHSETVAMFIVPLLNYNAYILLWLKIKTQELERPSWWQFHQRWRHWRREKQQHKNNIELRLEPMSGGWQLKESKTINEGKELSEHDKPSMKGEQQSDTSKSEDGKQPEQSNTVKEEKESPEQDKTSKKGDHLEDSNPPSNLIL